MILAIALAAGVLFGSGAYLLLKRDLIRVVAGIMLISQSATLTIIGSGLSKGPAAIATRPGAEVSDPLPQALALTALAVALAAVALLLALVHRVVAVFRTSEVDELAAGEARQEADLAVERRADQEEAS